MAEKERDMLEAISRARLMVSGRHRIPWFYGGRAARALIRSGLITEGGYLTDKGHDLRATPRRE